MSGSIDVVVAGAGPAGALAALLLARAGATVQLVDRARFPRPKLCGDTLNPGAVAILERLGIAGAIEGDRRVIEGMVVTGLYGVAVEGRYAADAPARAWAIRRQDLDARLVEAAVEAGAQFDDGVTVRAADVERAGRRSRVTGLVVEGEGGQPRRLPARVTIAADGRRSVIAASLGLARPTRAPRRWVVGGYFSGVEGLRDLGEMHVRRDHYVGVAPVPSGLANTCVVSSRRGWFTRPAELLREIVAADPVLCERFAGAALVAPVTVLGPMGVDGARRGVPGLLVAGDAAGFVDPITGDGVRFALRGGELAAQVALEMLDTGRPDGHLLLRRRRAEAFGRKLRFNRMVRRLVESPLGVAAGSAGARTWPGVLQRMIAYAGDVTAS